MRKALNQEDVHSQSLAEVLENNEVGKTTLTNDSNQHTREIRIQQIFAVVGDKRVAVAEVDTSQKKMIRVHEIIADRGKIGFDVNEESPAERENVVRRNGLFPTVTKDIDTLSHCFK